MAWFRKLEQVKVRDTRGTRKKMIRLNNLCLFLYLSKLQQKPFLIFSYQRVFIREGKSGRFKWHNICKTIFLTVQRSPRSEIIHLWVPTKCPCVFFPKSVNGLVGMIWHMLKFSIHGWWNVICSSWCLTHFDASSILPFTIFEPQYQEICELYVVMNRRATDFEATKLLKGRSGSLCGSKVLLVCC